MTKAAPFFFPEKKHCIVVRRKAYMQIDSASCSASADNPSPRRTVAALNSPPAVHRRTSETPSPRSRGTVAALNSPPAIHRQTGIAYRADALLRSRSWLCSNCDAVVSDDAGSCPTCSSTRELFTFTGRQASLEGLQRARDSSAYGQRLAHLNGHSQAKAAMTYCDIHDPNYTAHVTTECSRLFSVDSPRVDPPIRSGAYLFDAFLQVRTEGELRIFSMEQAAAFANFPNAAGLVAEWVCSFGRQISVQHPDGTLDSVQASCRVHSYVLTVVFGLPFFG